MARSSHRPARPQHRDGDCTEHEHDAVVLAATRSLHVDGREYEEPSERNTAKDADRAAPTHTCADCLDDDDARGCPEERAGDDRVGEPRPIADLPAAPRMWKRSRERDEQRAA